MTTAEVEAAIVSELDRQGCAYGGVDLVSLARAVEEACHHVTAEREVAWLIEANWPEDNRPPTPQWWHPKHGWMWDANKALRFSRKIDAEDYLVSQKFLSGKATEHVFLGEQEAA